jgi:8-oxo-dGTP diphosphatase
MTDPAGDPPPHIIVTAAVVERDGHFLVTRRLAGTHLAGLWEFPGGKCHPGETAEACIVREVREELGAGFEVTRLIFETVHRYAERSVELQFFRGELVGDPRPMLGQEIRWVPREALATLEFPPADALLVERLGRGEV